MTKVDCEDCHTCEKCKEKEKINIWSPVEILGWVAITVGLIGGFFQLRRSHGTKDLRSFSIIYLITATLAEILFLIQALVIKNVSITITRIGTAIYFGSFLVMWFIYEMNRKKK